MQPGRIGRYSYFLCNSTVSRNSNLEVLGLWKWFWGMPHKTRSFRIKVLGFCFMTLSGKFCFLYKLLISSIYLKHTYWLCTKTRRFLDSTVLFQSFLPLNGSSEIKTNLQASHKHLHPFLKSKREQKCLRVNYQKRSIRGKNHDF